MKVRGLTPLGKNYNVIGTMPKMLSKNFKSFPKSLGEDRNLVPQKFTVWAYGP